MIKILIYLKFLFRIFVRCSEHVTFGSHCSRHFMDAGGLFY